MLGSCIGSLFLHEASASGKVRAGWAPCTSEAMMTLAAESTALGKNALVMARVAEAEHGRLWRVTVFIARPFGEPEILADDIEVQLFDENGPMRFIDRPSGVWVEAGGTAGTTASAAFTFATDAATPTLLRIRWAGEVADLSISPAQK